jgi:hypothetical protein
MLKKYTDIGFSVTQQVVPVLIGKKDNPVIRIQIPVNSSRDKILTAVTLQLTGTTDIKDLQTLKLYYTGSAPVFATKNVFKVSGAESKSIIFTTGSDKWLEAIISAVENNSQLKAKLIGDLVEFASH